MRIQRKRELTEHATIRTTLYYRFLIVIIEACSVPADLTVRNQISFFKIGRIPVIEGKINGKKAYFIIDTGASVSILNESVSEHFGFNFLYTTDQHIVGFAGHAKINEVKNCVVELGIETIRNVSFKTRQMNELFYTIKQHEDIEIAGILGADFFTRYCIKIDFRRNTISF